MKRRLLTLLLGVGVCVAQAQISSFPYEETFETGPGNWTASGTNNSWEHGAPVGTFINVSGPCGDSSWVTNLSGDYNSSEESFLESPMFDFTGLSSDPTLRFDHIFLTESCCDEGWVEYSTNGGTTWTKLGTSTSPSGINWYNDAGNDWWDGSSGTAGDWRTAQHELTGLAGEDSVMVRFAFDSDGSVQEDGFGVDNIRIFTTLDDLEPAALITPTGAGSFTATETVTASVTNLGTATLTSIDICFSVDGGAQTCETFATTLAPNATQNYTFVATADLSAVGPHTIEIVTDLSTDNIPCNDTLMASVTTLQIINTFPYVEEFEAGDGGWTSAGTNNSWQYGVPNAPYITGSSNCGVNAWVTNLTGDYNNNEESVLTSPIFDCSGFSSDPVVRFDHIFETESCCDEGWVEISLDTGATWTKLGTSATGVNWYNDAGNDWWDGNTGNAGEWRIAAHEMTGAAGVSGVMLRFVFDSDGSAIRDGFGVDNILVFESFADAAPLGLVAPTSNGTFGATETVTVSVANTGTDTIFAMDICFSVDGGAFTCETFNTQVNPSILDDFTFVATANLATPGAHTITVVSDLSNDGFACNDTAVFTVNTIPVVTSFPYIQDFETNDGFWVTTGTNSSWEYGVPNAPYIDASAPCGNNAWVTNLTGDYNSSEDSFLESPVLDFSGFANDPILRFDHIFETESCCDEGWVEISLDSGNTWNKLGTATSGGINWYNDAGNDWWDNNSGGAGQWRTAMHTLTGTAGQGGVKIRYVLDTDGSVTRDGFGVDNILIADTVFNTAVVAMTPVDGFGCALDSSETVTVSVVNNGLDSIFSVPVCYEANGVTVCETFTSTVAPGDTVVLTFAQTADLSTVGNNTLEAYTTTDVFNCGDTLSFSIDNVVLSTTTTPSIVDCFGASTGTASVAVTGNTSTVLYNWSTGDTTAMIGNLSATVYSVIVTDSASGCVDSATVTLGQNAPITNTFAQSVVTCNGDADGSLTSTPAGGFGSFSYNWSTNDTTMTTSGLPAGIYNLTITDDLGCELIVTDTLIDPDAITAVTSSTDESCDGLDDGTATVTPDGGWGGFTYLWDDANNSTTATANGLADGTYNVTLTDMNGCTSTATVDVNPGLPNLMVSLGADTTICEDSSIVLDAGNAGATYLWSTGETTQTIVVDQASTVSVVVSENGSCDGTDEIEISVEICVGIEENIAGGFDVAFYPNPTNGELNMELQELNGENITVTILDLRGQVQQLVQLNNSGSNLRHTFDLSDLASGVYLVRLSSATKATVARITLN